MNFSLKPLSAKADIVLVFQIFQLLRYATFFIIGVAFAKSGLALKEIGVYETLMFLSGAISFFWVSGILTKLLSAYSTYKNNEPVLFNAFAILSIVSTLVFILILFVQEQLLALLKIEEQESYFKIFTWYILLNNITYINEHILLLKQNKKELLLYGVLSFVFTIGVTAIPVFIFQSLAKSLLLLVALAIIKILYSLSLIKRYEGFHFKLNLQIPLLVSALPLTLSLLASGSADYIDAFLVSYFFGPEQVAIFRYGAKELPIALIFANALGTAMIPQLVENKLSKLSISDFRNKIKNLLHIVFPVSILLMFVVHWAYPLIFSTSFTESASVFSIYLLLVISRVIFPQTLLIAAGYHKAILTTSIFEIIINIVASILLLNKFGMLGIAYGTLIAFFSEKLILAFHLYTKCNISILEIIPLKTYIIYCLLLLMSFYFSLIIL